MQLICVYVETDNEDVGKPVSDYFGVNQDISSVSLCHFSFGFLLFSL